jgi:twinkle protein
MTKRKKKNKFETSAEPPIGHRIAQYEPCPLCGSSDAMAIYEKEIPKNHYQSWCFSCKGIQTAWSAPELYEEMDWKDMPNFTNVKQLVTKREEIKEMSEPTKTKDVELDFDYKDIADWGISKKVCEEVGIGVKHEVFTWGCQRKIFQNYKNELGQITAQKVRTQNVNWVMDSAGEPSKDANGKRIFETDSTGRAKWEYIKTEKGKEIKSQWYGNVADTELFGMDRARRMSSKKIVIVEGEKDLAAFASIFDRFAVVSVKDGASGVSKDCKKFFQFLNDYEEIIVIGDNDDAGRQMNRDVAALFPRKHKVVHLDKFNDVQDYFINNAVEEFKSCFFNAKKQVPQMVKPISELTHLLFEPDPPCYCEYPWPSFNDKLGGIHLGEVVGILAHEKVGKTSFLRNVAHQVWKTTGDPVGIIFLEDVKKDLVKGMVSLQLGINLNKKGVTVPPDMLRKAADELSVDDRIYFKAEGGPGETDALMDVIDWMIAVGCKVIFFDNVSTLIVGDTASDSERQGIDNLIVECRDRATASEVCIFVVQHLNRQGSPRGSHALPIFASTTLELIRDADTEDEVAKNTTEVICRGNRKFGFRGEVALLNYEHDTSYLTELNQNSILAYKEWKEKVKEESKKRN